MSERRPVVLIVATFVTLAVGFAAGWFLRPQLAGDDARAGMENPEAAPHPVGAQEYVQLGMTALSSGEFPEAERRFRQALELAPDSPDVHADLAVSLMYQERWDDAWDEIRTAREADPEMPETYFLEGVVQRDGRADTAAAKAAWERFLEIVPEDSPQAITVRQWMAEIDGTAPAGVSEDAAPVEGT